MLTASPPTPLQYSWSNWTLAMDQVIGVIRLDANVDNIILLPGLDWSYDYYGAYAQFATGQAGAVGAAAGTHPTSAAPQAPATT